MIQKIHSLKNNYTTKKIHVSKNNHLIKKIQIILNLLSEKKDSLTEI